MNYEKQCQSCGMPLKNGELSGSEKDGSKSLKYCNLCYKDGAFCDPDLTLDQMKTKVDTALKEKGWIKPLRWFAKLQLPRLERWKK
jgi:hypothetical protein